VTLVSSARLHILGVYVVSGFEESSTVWSVEAEARR
jgi:hypothetical protein